MTSDNSGKPGYSPVVSEETVVAGLAPIGTPDLHDSAAVRSQESPAANKASYRPIWAPGAYAQLMHSQNKNVVREITSSEAEQVTYNVASPITAEFRVPTADLTAITGIRPADYSSDIAEMTPPSPSQVAVNKGPKENNSPQMQTRASRRGNPNEAKRSSKKLLDRFRRR